MAEIEVERRGGRSVLPWILGLLLLAALAWALMSFFGSDEEGVEVRESAPTAEAGGP